jgi:Galactose oxidase, central domain
VPPANATARLLLIAALVAGCGGAATVTPTPALTPVASPTASASAAPSASASALPLPSTAPSVVGSASPSVAPSAGLPDSLAWRPLVVPNAPGPREDQTWTVDPAGRVAYMFGGRSGGESLDELWRFDLETDSWTQLEPPAPRPAARFGHVAAWDGSVGLLIWSGQQSADRFFDDLWIYDPAFNVWQVQPADGQLPAARYGSCGGFGGDGMFWISHGFTMDSGRFHDTRAYDLASGRWFDRTPAGQLPVDRCLHDCFWSSTGELVLYGGQTTGVKALGDLWTFGAATRTWTEQADPPLAARQLYALTTVAGRAYFFGGGDIDGGYLSDLWQLDVASLGWSQLAPTGAAPAARSAATLIADEGRSRLLLLGGKNDAGEFGDLWQLSAP